MNNTSDISSSADNAIKLAMEGRWEEAVELNRSIIEVYPYDVEAHNRLGKALASSGLYEEAKAAYEHAIEIDPANTIAKKNIQRLSSVTNEQAGTKTTPNIDPKVFIEETGKSRVINLYRIAPKETISRMSAGDPARLEITEQRLIVNSEFGEYLGELDARTASRLIELIEGGNTYQVAIANIWDEELKVMIRETYQHPSQAGHPSFPPRVIDEPKPYLKDTLVRYDIEEDISDDEPDEPGDIEGATDWEEDDDAIDGDDRSDDDDDLEDI